MPVIIRNGKVYGGVPTVDTELLLDSTNPVENRAIAEAIQEIKDSEILHWIGTREEYDAAIEAGEIEDGTIIIITDEPDVDNLPTENSTNLVYSGGVWTALQAKQDVFQVAELPTANEDEVGKIYQFIGTTDTNYTNGYFYECVEDSTTDPATYAWVRKDVQPFGEVVKYVDTLPSGNNIEDVIYGLRNYSNVVSKLTNEGFLDDDANFEYNNNVYTAADGVEIQSSTDGVTWSDFVSLTFADPDFNLVQADGTYSLVSGTDTFYYRTVKREFYVGDSDRETIYKITSDVTDSVTNGDMNPVTSNAVYDYVANVETITPVAVTGGAAGTVTWGSFDVKKIGKLVTININNMKHTNDVDVPGGIVIATGLPKPVTGRFYLVGLQSVGAYIDGLGNFGIDVGFMRSTDTLYGSATYICAE